LPDFRCFALRDQIAKSAKLFHLCGVYLFMPFRADDHALRARKEALENALREIAGATKHYEQLKREQAERERELADIESVLASGKQKHALPLLQNIRIAAPCKKDWNEMVGDEYVRFCGSCEKNVYNLSSLTREQAEALLQEKEGNMCVTYFQRADGTVMTTDCPVGVRKRRVRNALAAVVAGAGAAVAAAFGHQEQRVAGGIEPLMGEPVIHQMPQLMGDIAPEPTVRVAGGIAPPHVNPEVKKVKQAPTAPAKRAPSPGPRKFMGKYSPSSPDKDLL